jgi:low temperature requirement protein LtrA
MLKPPSDPTRRVDAAHLAERFGLMMIILLGEVVVAVAGSAVEVPDHDLWYWLGLLAGLILAAALWWIYFTAAAPISESVLRASGGNPSMAYGLYAGGHLSPAFALLTMAAGMSLALSGEAPPAAAWFITGGLASYLVGNRALATDQFPRFGQLVRAAATVVTVCLALLEPLISTTGVVMVTAAWTAAIAAYVTWRAPGRLKGIAANPLAYFRSDSR